MTALGGKTAVLIPAVQPRESADDIAVPPCSPRLSDELTREGTTCDQ
ncbi:hypothetical protein [Kibdelosporangium philippinense]